MKTFGDTLHEVMVNKGYTLRALAKKLEARKSTISLMKLSKILRNIQNPSNKQEFDELMNALDVTDSQILKELETLAMSFIPPRKLSEEELVQSLPAFVPAHIQTPEQLEEFKKYWFKTMQEDQEPE